MMKNNANKKTLITLLILLAIIFAAVTIRTARSTYDKRLAEENLTELDFFSMQKYCGENAKAVMDALRAGSKDKLDALMLNAAGTDDLLAFADWSKADFSAATSMGAGSLSAAPDENGRMDVSERFIVDAGDSKYVLFIETVTSRWGRNNDGVSAVSATTFEHYDETGYDWLGEPDGQSVLAGELFWNK